MVANLRSRADRQCYRIAAATWCTGRSVPVAAHQGPRTNAWSVALLRHRPTAEVSKTARPGGTITEHGRTETVFACGADTFPACMTEVNRDRIRRNEDIRPL